MNNVIGMHGEPILKPGEPNAALVGVCRELLAKAETGELAAFVAAGLMANGDRMSAGYDGDETDKIKLLGAMAWMQADYIRRASGS